MKKEISYLETLKAIDECKKHFESQLEARLGLIKVQSPLFVKTSTGLQDKLTGIEGKPLYQAISNSRAAISEAIGIEAIDKEFAFDENMSRNGDTLVIPFAKNGGNIEFINF